VDSVRLPVSVRAWRPEDAPAFVEAARESAADIAPWMPWCHADYSLEEAEAWITRTAEGLRTGKEHELAIVDAADRVLGGIGINQINLIHRFANLGYWVRSTATGRGVAPAAVRLLAEFGFAMLELERLEILVTVGNTRSLRVAEKVGALREGVLRNRLRVRDVQLDAVMHSLVPGEPRP
jgi:RimJ/RimL family protein N-acetyltransferase